MIAGGLLDFAIGCAIAYRRTARTGLFAALAISVFYIVAGTLVTPRSLGRAARADAEDLADHGAEPGCAGDLGGPVTLYFVLKFLHVIGAAVLLGTGAGIAFFMLLAHRSGRRRDLIAGGGAHRRCRRFSVHRDRGRRAAGHRRSRSPISTGYPLGEGWIVLSIAALPADRRVLAAGRVDADADARSGHRRGAARRAAAAGLSPPVLDLVRVRLPGFRGGARRLLADADPSAHRYPDMGHSVVAAPTGSHRCGERDAARF